MAQYGTRGKLDQTVRRNVEKYGWDVNLVLEEPGTPGWAYSIGLYRSFKHPEVLIFGLAKELAHALINDIGADVRNGKTFRSGARYPELLESVVCHFQNIEKCWYTPFLGRAVAFYNGQNFPVLQCIWPDKQSRFPWEADFRRDWLWAQPLLFHSDPKSANAEALLRTVQSNV
jgi:hypothetical protein